MVQWLEVPRNTAWFNDPDYMDDLEDHMSDPRIRQWIVMRHDTPVAYLQDYAIDGWDDHPLGFLPQGARGMDTLIGTADDMNRGLGTAYLSQHRDRLFDAGVPALGIDPHPDNAAAIRCYEKVGFHRLREAHTPWGHVVLMDCWPTRAGGV